MENKTFSVELITQMLKEFVIVMGSGSVHPDICDKGAAVIEALLAENKQLKEHLIGKCSACQHVGNYTLNSPCDNCLHNSRITGGNGWGLKNNWELKSCFSVPSPVPNDPLTQEDLRSMAKKPYWHVGLRAESEPPHWAIMESHIAQRPQDYHYGEYWLAYRSETEGPEQTTNKPIDSVPASDNIPLTVDDLKKMYDNGDGQIWVTYRAATLPAVLDLDAVDRELVAVWCSDSRMQLREKDYGVTWLAFRKKPTEESAICASTGKPCCHCQPGPCEHRKCE